MLCLLISIPWIIIEECNPQYNAFDFRVSLLCLNLIQILLVQIIWFSRLYFTFKNTALKLSPNTIRLYIFALIFLTIIAAMAIGRYIFNYGDREQANYIWSVLLSLFSICRISIHISFCIVFINRLIKVHNYLSMDGDEDFVHTITKNTLLTILSLSITIFAACAALWGLTYNEQHIVWRSFIAFYGVTMDQYSNCMTAMLSFKYFDGLYRKTLGCIDNCCKLCWYKMLEAKHSRNTSANMEMAISDTKLSKKITSMDNEDGDDGQINLNVDIDTSHTKTYTASVIMESPPTTKSITVSTTKPFRSIAGIRVDPIDDIAETKPALTTLTGGITPNTPNENADFNFHG